MENTQVAVTDQNKALATQAAMTQAMEDAGFDLQDITIPKVLLMQNTSEMVGDEKAKLGDIVNSQTLEVLGGFAAAVEFVPLTVKKVWRVYDTSDGNPVFRRQEDWTATNDKLPWEDTDSDGVEIRRDKCYLVYALLAKDIEAGEAFPVAISFHRTGTTAGKQVTTHMFKMISCGKDPLSRSLVLAPRKEKNEANTYAVYTVAKGNDIGAAATAEARKWLGVLKSTRHTVHEAEGAVKAGAVASTVGKDDDVAL